MLHAMEFFPLFFLHLEHENVLMVARKMDPHK